MKNPEEYSKLTKGEKFICDWQMGILSGFKQTLQKLLSLSDPANRVKLHLAFPEEVEAWNKYRTEAGWWPKLAERVGIEY